MQDILNYLPVLLVSMGMNILLGVYYKIGISKVSFDPKLLLNGVGKAAIIGIVFVGMAFCFDRVDLSSLGVSPCIFMHSAIFLYMGKVLNKLAKILGVQVKKQDSDGRSEGSVLAEAASAMADSLTAAPAQKKTASAESPSSLTGHADPPSGKADSPAEDETSAPADASSPAGQKSASAAEAKQAKASEAAAQ